VNVPVGPEFCTVAVRGWRTETAEAESALTWEAEPPELAKSAVATPQFSVWPAVKKTAEFLTPSWALVQAEVVQMAQTNAIVE
jgi:hypothetical protein